MSPNTDIPIDNKASPIVNVTIEVPRGSFVKRGSNNQIDFISPLPCPFNYGSVHDYIGGEGDLLDAVVLGPRLDIGSQILIAAHGSVGLCERFMSDDKLICAAHPLTTTQRLGVLAFFYFYAQCKGALNLFRGQRGRSFCAGWGDAKTAIDRATPRRPDWQGPPIAF